jgi:hypothetical protein
VGAPFLSRRSASDFQAWRDERDWTAEKYVASTEASGCRRTRGLREILRAMQRAQLARTAVMRALNDHALPDKS